MLTRVSKLVKQRVNVASMSSVPSVRVRSHMRLLHVADNRTSAPPLTLLYDMSVFVCPFQWVETMNKPLSETDPVLHDIMEKEKHRQRCSLALIASEVRRKELKRSRHVCLLSAAHSHSFHAHFPPELHIQIRLRCPRIHDVQQVLGRVPRSQVSATHK